MHATLHPNFQRLRPRSPHTHLRKSEPRASPSPSGFPRAAPSPPLQHRSGRQEGFQPGTAAVLFSSASPGSRSPSPGSAASGCAPDRPFSLPQPAPALARPLAPGLEVGGHSGHRRPCVTVTLCVPAPGSPADADPVVPGEGELIRTPAWASQSRRSANPRLALLGDPGGRPLAATSALLGPVRGRGARPPPSRRLRARQPCAGAGAGAERAGGIPPPPLPGPREIQPPWLGRLPLPRPLPLGARSGLRNRRGPFAGGSAVPGPVPARPPAAAAPPARAAGTM
uniref:Uncharacterized protein n=1 Tax=Rangifer tarandus platyrhynchus TaxID=3082113 RepID=A0ACB0DQ52_RANTA|nr:unnamed protein product [Rangifer tarandus platyrhynchus]